MMSICHRDLMVMRRGMQRRNSRHNRSNHHGRAPLRLQISAILKTTSHFSGATESMETSKYFYVRVSPKWHKLKTIHGMFFGRSRAEVFAKAAAAEKAKSGVAS
mgnify:CR=1 FL=1